MATNPFEQPLASEQARATPTAGNPFDQPLSSEQSAAQQPTEDSAISRLASGLWSTTLGPIVSVGKELKSYYDAKTAAQNAIDAAGGPAKMLADAVSDPNHPLHKLGAGIVNGAWDQVKQAANAGASAIDAERAGLSALIHGNLTAASTAGQQMSDSASEAAGHALAAELPGVGPAAADAGQKIGSGNVAGGVGEAGGLIGAKLLGGEAAEPEDVTNAVKGAGNKAKALVSEEAAAQTAQPSAQSAIRESTADVNRNLRITEGVAPEASASIRDSVQDVADAVKARSKAAFQTLDEASGGRWQRFDDQLSNLRDKMAETAGVDDDLYAKFEQRAQDVEQAQNDMLDSLTKQGKIQPEMAEQAKADYKQASALSDLSQNIRAATKGRAGFDAEQVNVSSLRDRANKLYDSGRLQQALGDEGANRFMQQISEANRIGKDAISRAKLVKTVLKYSAVAGGLGAAGHLAAGLMGGK